MIKRNNAHTVLYIFILSLFFISIPNAPPCAYARLIALLIPNCIKVHRTISSINSSVIFNKPANAQLIPIMDRATHKIVTITMRGRIPVRSNLWWKWFLSGMNGFLPSRTRCITTLTTSNSGTMSVEKANTRLTCPVSPSLMSMRLRWMTSRLMI